MIFEILYGTLLAKDSVRFNPFLALEVFLGGLRCLVRALSPHYLETPFRYRICMFIF